MFGTKGIETEKGGGGGIYIYPGIYDRTIIKSVELAMSSNNNPKVVIGFTTAEGIESDPNDPPIRKIATTFSDNNDANEKNASKLTHLATKLIPRATIDAIEAPDAKAWASMFVSTIGPQLLNKEFRMKFSGEEYLNDANEVKVAPRIPLYKFAEATQDGAEYAPVPKEQSQLSYDENNKYDLKRLANTNGAASQPSATSAPTLPDSEADDL